MSARRAWYLWILLALVASLVHLITLRLSPPIWQDEVEIIELGRNVFPGADHTWSTIWSSSGKPVRILNYIGPFIQELAFQLGGGSELGPRVSALLGTLLAGTFLLGWLLSRGREPWVALTCASLLFLDPLFAQSWRGARVDCWVFAFIFLSCWLIWRSTNARGSATRHAWLGAAGVVLAIAGLTWASAILLVPLVLHEIAKAYQLRLVRDRIRELIPLALTLAASAALTAAVLLLPVWDWVESSLGGTSSAVRAAADRSSLAALGPAILTSYVWSPWVFCFGVLLMVANRDRILMLAFLLVVVVVGLTFPYTHRVLYLLPYLLLSLSGAPSPDAKRQGDQEWRAKAVQVAACLLVCWSATLTLGARTWNAWRQRHERSPDQFMRLANSAIGPGALKVYNPNHELYYAGRRLGWKQFRIFDYVNFGKPEVSATFAPILEAMDFVIVRVDENSDLALRGALPGAGLVPSDRNPATTGARLDDGSTGKKRPGAFRLGTYQVFVRGRPGVGTPPP